MGARRAKRRLPRMSGCPIQVEALNIEAFPEEERVPLSEFLCYEDQKEANFFAFYHENVSLRFFSRNSPIFLV